MLLPNVERIFTHRKMALSILNFSIWPHALTSNYRMDLNAIASFRDCELSIGFIGSKSLKKAPTNEADS